MKKLFYLFFVLSLVLMLAGCQKKYEAIPETVYDIKLGMPGGYPYESEAIATADEFLEDTIFSVSVKKDIAVLKIRKPVVLARGLNATMPGVKEKLHDSFLKNDSLTELESGELIINEQTAVFTKYKEIKDDKEVYTELYTVMKNGRLYCLRFSAEYKEKKFVQWFSSGLIPTIELPKGGGAAVALNHDYEGLSYSLTDMDAYEPSDKSFRLFDKDGYNVGVGTIETSDPLCSNITMKAEAQTNAFYNIDPLRDTLNDFMVLKQGETTIDEKPALFLDYYETPKGTAYTARRYEVICDDTRYIIKFYSSIPRKASFEQEAERFLKTIRFPNEKKVPETYHVLFYGIQYTQPEHVSFSEHGYGIHNSEGYKIADFGMVKPKEYPEDIALDSDLVAESLKEELILLGTYDDVTVERTTVAGDSALRSTWQAVGEEKIQYFITYLFLRNGLGYEIVFYGDPALKAEIDEVANEVIATIIFTE